MKRKSALLIMLLFFVTTLFTGCGETENQQLIPRPILPVPMQQKTSKKTKKKTRKQIPTLSILITLT